MTRMELRPQQLRGPVTHVLVALDGSAFAERAVAPAVRLADRLGVPLHYVRTETVLGGVATADGQGDHPLLCLATHGRNRSAAVTHSASATVLAGAHEPVLLVGPEVPADPPVTGRLAACVDGTPDSEEILAAATCWAGALGLGVTALTVAEPVPESIRRPGTYPRLHGPHGDADAYIRDLAAAWSGDVAVTGRAIYDPVDVNGALVAAFAAEPPELVVMGTRAPHGLRRLILGSTAAAVAHGAPAPVLVIPL